MISRALRQALLLVALASLPAIGEALYLRDRVSWQSPVPASEMVKVELARSWGDNAIWVDARSDEEFEQDHVPDAILLNEDRWSELLPQFLAKWSHDKKVVVYCKAESCNAALEVARRLRKQTDPPMENVFVLDGGWEGWVKAKK